MSFPPDSRSFRYLTLPSEDMLDIRLLRDSLRPRNLRLKYLGFFWAQNGKPEDIRMNISENDVQSAEDIDDTSLVIREKIQSIGDTNGFGFKEFQKHAPFHAINLDLCDHFAAPSIDRRSALVQVVHNIADVQCKRSRDEWLLFITSRIDSEYFSKDYAEAFRNAILLNFEKSDQFQKLTLEILEGEGPEIVDEFVADLTQVHPARIRDFFCIGFGKWLLRLLGSSTPAATVEMRPSYFYSVNEGPDMLSLAYRFTPRVTGVSDSFGIASGNEPLPHDTADVEELNMAFKLIENTHGLLDVDDLLYRRQDLMLELASETKKYLEEAKYDVATYDEYFGIL